MTSVRLRKGETTSRASTYRRNLKRHPNQRKIMGHRVGTILQTRYSAVEIAVVESKRQDKVDGQTNFMSDLHKIQKSLKNQLDFVIHSLRDLASDFHQHIEVIGIVHHSSGSPSIDLPFDEIYLDFVRSSNFPGHGALSYSPKSSWPSVPYWSSCPTRTRPPPVEIFILFIINY
ncbi:hypothetical protein BC936DRAFT_136868 [Jimgerdemannia flammicorona]|uniref:Uncharacterized protein n=1 Tax=Jimgerdemannia flammicorona TaxID=994334 RepID=A0A433CYL8_9FUNG|nr:hypothetical protein BC936DRAFT_136868 [Jimgerdemannia flammicorona]